MKNIKFKAYVKSFIFTSLLLMFVVCITVVDTNTKKTAGYINTGVFVNYNENEISLEVFDKSYTLSNTAYIKKVSSEIVNLLNECKNIANLYIKYCNY